MYEVVMKEGRESREGGISHGEVLTDTLTFD